MKLVNKTKYHGRDIRAFITWVSNQEYWTSAMRKRLSVEVVPARKLHTGTAWSGSYYIEIRIPGPDKLNKPLLASLIAHELTHLTNKKHILWKTERWMRGSGRYGYRDCDKFWSEASALELRMNEPKVKVKATPMDKAEAGLKNAMTKVAEYNRKIRLAENRLKKWRQKARYYERRMKTLEGQPPLKPRQASKPSEETLVRRAINRHITTELADCDRQMWEIYSMMRRPSMQVSGLRYPSEEDWEGDFTELKDARKIVQPGETMMFRGYKNEQFWDEFYMVIPIREELLKKAAQEEKV